MKPVAIASAIGLALGLQGCNSANTVMTQPMPVAPPAEVAEYRVGPGDVLDIRVWGAQDLSTTQKVRADGIITMPLGGDLTATGKTTEQLNAEIVESLNQYLQKPVVTVIVNQSDSDIYAQRVRITGAVNDPQSVPWRQGMTVLDLVLLAGGPNQFAKAEQAKLIRNTVDGQKMYPINIDELLNGGNLDANYVLGPSDMITIPEHTF